MAGLIQTGLKAGGTALGATFGGPVGAKVGGALGGFAGSAATGGDFGESVSGGIQGGIAGANQAETGGISNVFKENLLSSLTGKSVEDIAKQKTGLGGGLLNNIPVIFGKNKSLLDIY